MSAEDYRALAQECMQLAQQTSDPNAKARLTQMAQKWRELADRAEKNELKPRK